MEIRAGDMNEALERGESEKLVLLVEREPELRKVIRILISQLGLDVLETDDPLEAELLLERHDPDMFLLEYVPPGQECGRLIEQFRSSNPGKKPGVILMAAQRPQDDWRNTFRPDLVVYKPFDVRYLIRQLNMLQLKGGGAEISKHRAARRNGWPGREIP